MKVYSVEKYFDFEGGDIVAIYSNEEEAKKHTEWLEKRIKKNKEYADNVKLFTIEVLEKFNKKDWE